MTVATPSNGLSLQTARWEFNLVTTGLREHQYWDSVQWSNIIYHHTKLRWFRNCRQPTKVV